MLRPLYESALVRATRKVLQGFHKGCTRVWGLGVFVVQDIQGSNLLELLEASIACQYWTFSLGSTESTVQLQWSSFSDLRPSFYARMSSRDFQETVTRVCT